jgi:hypothetical protein
VEENVEETMPEEYVLHQNYPNPFNPSTVITFDIPGNSYVSLKVYTSIGEEVTELAGGQYSAGRHTVRFDATELTCGIYFYTIRAGNFTTTKKLLLLR